MDIFVGLPIENVTNFIIKTVKFNHRNTVSFKNSERDDTLIVGSLRAEDIPYGKDITRMEIGTAVTDIYADAFTGCKSLTDIVAYDFGELKSVGDRAFYRCSSLSRIVIPATCETVGGNAFYECSSARQLVFSGKSRLHTISGGAFQLCAGLEYIEIPESVTSIELYAFYSCKFLHSVTLSGKPDIGDSAFYWCDRLREITAKKYTKDEFIDLISKNNIFGKAYDWLHTTKITCTGGEELTVKGNSNNTWEFN